MAGTSIKNALILASTEMLLTELMGRGALTACSGNLFMDGREVSKAKRVETDQSFEHFVELRALEIMSRGMATAKPADKVHQFSIVPAAGDFAPGSISASVQMLAVSTQTGKK